MNDPYRLSPMVGGSMICLGAVFIALSGYFYFDDVQDKPSRILTLQILAGTGYVLWIFGSVFLAKARFSSPKAGFICGLALVPGLIALLTVVRTRTRQEIWQEANPDLAGRAQSRQYRDVKSLY